MFSNLIACSDFVSQAVAWCNENQGFCMIVLTAMLAYCTWKSCRYADKNIKAMREIEGSRARPQIALEVVQDNPFYIVRMVNLGLTAAHSITVEIAPRLSYCFDRWRGRKIGFLEDGVKWLAPSAAHQTNIGSFRDVETVNKTLVYNGFISYKGPDGKMYRDPFVLDFSLYKDTVYSSKKTIDSIGNELEKLRRAVELFGNGFNKLRVVAQSLDEYRAEEKAFVEKFVKGEAGDDAGPSEESEPREV